ncbi:MAG TPA: hypothetical protein VKT70_06880 [Stellaceae bacterium]|nr:hypothetical protein [Stellaceae bacterium]
MPPRMPGIRGIHLRYPIKPLFLMVLAACTQTKEAPLANAPLAIHAKCQGSETCVFDGRDLFIEIIITNEGSIPIGFPLAFRQKSGPSIRLVDASTKAELTLPTTLADPDLAFDFTTIPPGHSVTLEWVITPSEIKRFEKPAIEVSAEITIACRIQVNGELKDFQGTDALPITGKEIR